MAGCVCQNHFFFMRDPSFLFHLCVRLISFYILLCAPLVSFLCTPSFPFLPGFCYHECPSFVLTRPLVSFFMCAPRSFLFFLCARLISFLCVPVPIVSFLCSPSFLFFYARPSFLFYARPSFLFCASPRPIVSIYFSCVSLISFL